MEKHKIVHFTSVHSAFDTRIFHKECKTLAEAGYEVVLIAPHDRDETINGVRIRAIPKPKGRRERMTRTAWRVYRVALQENADLYHFHDPELIPIGLLLKACGKRVIYDVHEDVPQQILTKHWIPSLLRRPIAAIFNIVEKFIAHWLDAIVTATEGIAENFKGFNVVVVHNYPDLAMLPISSSPQRAGDEKVLVYVGAISRLRGAFEMVRALEHLSPAQDIRLDLIGRFEPSSLEKELQTLPSYRQVRFLGWLQPSEVYKRLKEADIGLVCLHPEPRFVVAWPVKLFEYMAAGLPVVASNFPLWKEIVEGNECGLTVDPLNPKEIAQAIEYLLDHPELRQKMGENGRRAVLEKYNWEKESEKLVALYKRLLKS